MLAGAAAGLDRELAFAFGAISSIPFDGDSLAEHCEISGCRYNLSAMAGFISEADNAASVLILHGIFFPQIVRRRWSQYPHDGPQQQRDHRYRGRLFGSANNQGFPVQAN